MVQKILHIMLCLLAILLPTACTIQPPLKLAPDPEDVIVKMPIVITDLEVVWDVEDGWRKEWYYGWDEQDEAMWGKLEYPLPTNFEVRRYYVGERPDSLQFKARDGFTVYGDSFRRRYQIGWYNMLLWSNIDSPDGTQTVIIDENDPGNVWATTSKTRIGYNTPQQRTRVVNTHNQPEIFYSTYIRDIYISPNVEDYDYFDPEESVWVKRLHADLPPMVYIYLVQVILHNNRGRITGTADQSSIDGLADGVSLHTGATSQVDANITFDMRLKYNLPVGEEQCDILGGKLTTYGLCGMQPWKISRVLQEAPRQDLENRLSLCLMFRNGEEAVYPYDVTNQIRKKPHGGVITIHINVDDIEIPQPPGGGASGFIPTVEDPEEEIYEFGI